MDTLSSRRRFLAGIAVLAGSAVVSRRSWEAVQLASASSPPSESAIDFSHSFVAHNSSFNAVRFSIQSATTIGSTTIYHCASMRAENTFVDDALFQPDNFSFTPIFDSIGNVLKLRTWPDVRGGEREVIRAKDGAWGEPTFIVPVRSADRLGTWSDIADATAAGLPIVARTSVELPVGTVKFEFPTKTINISHERRKYQVDTGPLAFPSPDADLATISVAHIAFGRGDAADFILQGAVPVGDVHVFGYPERLSLPAVNQLFALRGA
jgi:hypothetical protein